MLAIYIFKRKNYDKINKSKIIQTNNEKHSNLVTPKTISYWKTKVERMHE